MPLTVRVVVGYVFLLVGIHISVLSIPKLYPKLSTNMLERNINTKSKLRAAMTDGPGTRDDWRVFWGMCLAAGSEKIIQRWYFGVKYVSAYEINAQWVDSTAVTSPAAAKKV